MIDTDQIINEIKREIRVELQNYNRLYNGGSPSKRALGTLFFNLYELKIIGEHLDPFNLVGIEQAMNKISDELVQQAGIHFFGNLYEVKFSFDQRNYRKLQNQLNWSINDLYAMHVQILQEEIESHSLESAFFDRLKDLIEVDCKLINKNDDNLFKLATINLCSVNMLLIDYIEFNGEYVDLAKQYLKLSFKTLDNVLLNNKNDNVISLFLYVYLVLEKASKIVKGDISVNLEELMEYYESKISNLREYDCILGLSNIYKLDTEKFIEIFNVIFNKLSSTRKTGITRPFYIKILIFYLNELDIKETIDLNINPVFDALNVEEIINKLFPEYVKAKEIEITGPDLEKLMTYDDPDIRTRLAQIFKRSDYISDMEKERLILESTKPHTGYEISDFEIPIGSSRIYACMPIKSAREISENSVPEKYAYQIIKPFNHFYDKCAVIFVTSKKCSQPLSNYIKKLNSLHDFPVGIIEEKNLCKIFKFYDVLD